MVLGTHHLSHWSYLMMTSQTVLRLHTRNAAYLTTVHWVTEGSIRSLRFIEYNNNKTSTVASITWAKHTLLQFWQQIFCVCFFYPKVCFFFEYSFPRLARWPLVQFFPRWLHNTLLRLPQNYQNCPKYSADLHFDEFHTTVLVHHESRTCWTNNKRADWPKLS